MCIAWLVCATSSEALAGMQEVALEQNPAALAPEAQWTSVAKARDAAFVQAVVLEAEAIVPGDLGPERQAALRKELAASARSLVLSYAAEHYAKEMVRIRYRADVVVNTAELKSRLKRWGAFYTAGNPLGFRLATQGLTQEQRQEITHWQSVSGVQPQQVEFPALHATYQQGRWRLQLETAKRQWQSVSAQLGTAWQSVWSRYFEQPEVQARVVQRRVLEVSGWPSVEGAIGWQQRLTRFDDSVDEATLLNLRVDGAGIRAQWRVDVLDVSRLKARLGRLAPKHGVQFELRPASQ